MLQIYLVDVFTELVLAKSFWEVSWDDDWVRFRKRIRWENFQRVVLLAVPIQWDQGVK